MNLFFLAGNIQQGSSHDSYNVLVLKLYIFTGLFRFYERIALTMCGVFSLLFEFGFISLFPCYSRVVSDLPLFLGAPAN